MLLSLRQKPSLSRRSISMTILAVVLWVGGVWSRPHLIRAHCVHAPEDCTSDRVLTVDQSSFGRTDPRADLLSSDIQMAAAILLFGVPLGWNVGVAALGHAGLRSAILPVAQDLLIGIQTAAWNGVGVELSHLLTQRARPFVYGKPEDSHFPSNYTSFYSGHTSFTAAAMMALILILLSRGAPQAVLVTTAIAGQTMVVSVAVLRVLAGRHFLTDVAVGAVAGACVAVLVALAARLPSRRANPECA